MSIVWTLPGTFGQLMLAVCLFMLVAFSAGGLVNGGDFRPAQVRVLDLSALVLPGTCLWSAAIVLVRHWQGAGAQSYAWYALPLGATALYLIYFSFLVHQSRGGR